MKILLNLSVFLTGISVVVSLNDYCGMEYRLCGKENHIGCDQNIFKNMEDLHSLKIRVITNNLIDLILDKINSYRNSIATGNTTPFTKASNMRIVTWNSELEYLSSQLVMKLPIWDFTSCSKTDSNPRSIEIHHDKNEILDSSEFLKWAFDDMLDYSIEFKKSSKLDFSLFYSADLTGIGCAFGSYNDEGEKMVLKCILNEIDANSLTESYLPGIPCSNCSIYNQVCSEVYPGLCDDIKISTMKRSEVRSEESYIFSASSIFFWSMYILLAFGVGVAIFISFKARRHAKGFPSVAYLRAAESTNVFPL